MGLGQGEPLSLLPLVPLASEVVVGHPVRSILRLHHTLLRSVPLLRLLWSVPLLRLRPLLPTYRISYFAALQVGAYDHAP